MAVAKRLVKTYLTIITIIAQATLTKIAKKAKNKSMQII